MNNALQMPGVSLATDSLIALRRVALTADTGMSLAALPGGFATRRKGQGLEVADIRDYVTGDDMRHLDRGTTARTGRLHVRQFQQERDRVTLLVADFRSAMFWGLRRAFRSVAAAEALALLGWNIVESGGRVSLLAITPGAPIIVPPRSRTRAMLDVIGGLVQAHRLALDSLMAEPPDDAPLDEALTRASRLVPAGAELVIASGFDNAGTDFPDRLDELSRRFFLRLLLLTDAEASDLPRGHYPMRLADGRYIRVHLGQNAKGEDLTRDIAGRTALVLNASDSVDETARRLSAMPKEVAL